MAIFIQQVNDDVKLRAISLAITKGREAPVGYMVR